jgi:hypothetical protein
MCERSGKRGCCIVYVRKLSFMPEKRASPRLNIRHVKPAVSSSIGEEEGISRGRFSIRKFRTQDCLKRYFIIWIPGKNYFWTFYLSPNYERGILNLIHKMLNLIQIIIQSTSSQPHAVLRSRGYRMTKNSREHQKFEWAFTLEAILPLRKLREESIATYVL